MSSSVKRVYVTNDSSRARWVYVTKDSSKGERVYVTENSAYAEERVYITNDSSKGDWIYVTNPDALPSDVGNFSSSGGSSSNSCGCLLLLIILGAFFSYGAFVVLPAIFLQSQANAPSQDEKAQIKQAITSDVTLDAYIDTCVKVYSGDCNGARSETSNVIYVAVGNGTTRDITIPVVHAYINDQELDLTLDAITLVNMETKESRRAPLSFNVLHPGFEIVAIMSDRDNVNIIYRVDKICITIDDYITSVYADKCFELGK